MRKFVYIEFQISNLDTGVLIEHLLLRRLEYLVNLIEPITAQDYGVTVLLRPPKLIYHIFTSKLTMYSKYHSKLQSQKLTMYSKYHSKVKS